MALARTDLTSIHTTSTTPPIVTSSFTPPANSLLVAGVSINDNVANIDDFTISGGGLTWTRTVGIVSAGTFFVNNLWTAPVGGSPASMTVTVSGGGAFDRDIRVFAYTGYDTTTPIGGTGSATLSTTPILPFNLSSDPDMRSELVSVGACDAGTAANLGPGWLEVLAIASVVNMRTAYRNRTTSRIVTWSMTSGQDNIAVAMEVRAAPLTGSFDPPYEFAKARNVVLKRQPAIRTRRGY